MVSWKSKSRNDNLLLSCRNGLVKLLVEMRRVVSNNFGGMKPPTEPWEFVSLCFTQCYHMRLRAKGRMIQSKIWDQKIGDICFLKLSKSTSFRYLWSKFMNLFSYWWQKILSYQLDTRRKHCVECWLLKLVHCYPVEQKVFSTSQI